jgi:hypothetical protein
LTGFPSATALALTLGADSPCADERCAGNLGLSATRPFTLFIATHVSIRTSDVSSRPLDPPSQTYGTLLYHPKQSFNHSRPSPLLPKTTRARFTHEAHLTVQVFGGVLQLARRAATRASLQNEVDRTFLKDCLRSAASVIGLSPVTSSAQDDSISELLRFL